MTKQFVNYTVGEQKFQCGPYKEGDEADWHRKDIASYAGVSDVYLSPNRDTTRRYIHADFTT